MDFKKIGRQVHFIAASQNVSRNGEGSFIRLKKGDILFGYTEFNSCGREDEDVARICAAISHDEGKSFGEGFVLFEKPADAVNIMSLSFLRMANGDIGAFYIIKNVDGTDDIVLSRSDDEGATWSKPVSCISDSLPADYYILNNDRAVYLSTGRIILPLARHTIHSGTEEFTPGEILFVYSDDDGSSWSASPAVLKCPFPDDENGLQEPGIFEKKDGTLWCYIRTGLGCQFEAFSKDGGISWSAPAPNIFFSSPCSPMLVKKAQGATLAIFNPIPEHVLRDDEKEFWGRTPYVMAVNCRGDTEFSQEKLYYIEDDLNNGYCYPAVIECEDGLLVAYYHSNNTDCCLNSTKIIKIMHNEIE